MSQHGRRRAGSQRVEMIYKQKGLRPCGIGVLLRRQGDESTSLEGRGEEGGREGGEREERQERGAEGPRERGKESGREGSRGGEGGGRGARRGRGERRGNERGKRRRKSRRGGGECAPPEPPTGRPSVPKGHPVPASCPRWPQDGARWPSRAEHGLRYIASHRPPRGLKTASDRFWMGFWGDPVSRGRIEEEER